MKVDVSNDNLKHQYKPKVSYKICKSCGSSHITYENMIHDLKTPLSIIYNNIQELLRSEDLPEELNSTVNMIKKYWFKITKMINDTCDYEKINNGLITPNYRNYDIVILLKEVLYSTKPLADRKKIKINFESNVSSRLIAVDCEMIERILLNLLSNAYKFTKEHGEVNVMYITSDEGEYIKVIDNGIGISKDKIKKLYDRYYFEQSKENKSGSGLGLAIVKGFVSLLKGEISIISSDKGTEFCIWLPYFLLDKNPDEDKFYDDFYNENIFQIELSDDYY